jgi:hypothetical protein
MPLPLSMLADLKKLNFDVPNQAPVDPAIANYAQGLEQQKQAQTIADLQQDAATAQGMGHTTPVSVPNALPPQPDFPSVAQQMPQANIAPTPLAQKMQSLDTSHPIGTIVPHPKGQDSAKPSDLVFATAPAGSGASSPDISKLIHPAAGAATAAYGVPTVTPETAAAYQSYLNQKAQANESEYQIQNDQAKNNKFAIAGQLTDLGMQENLANSIASENKKRYQQTLDDYEKDRQEAYNGKVDPNHWFNSRSGAGKALAIISLIFGGHDIIQKQVDRDLAIQKEELDNKRRGFDEKKNLYAQKLKQFGPEAADAAFKEHQTQRYQLYAQQLLNEKGASQASIDYINNKFNLAKEKADLYAKNTKLIPAGGGSGKDAEKYYGERVAQGWSGPQAAAATDAVFGHGAAAAVEAKGKFADQGQQGKPAPVATPPAVEWGDRGAALISTTDAAKNKDAINEYNGEVDAKMIDRYGPRTGLELAQRFHIEPGMSKEKIERVVQSGNNILSIPKPKKGGGESESESSAP